MIQIKLRIQFRFRVSYSKLKPYLNDHDKISFKMSPLNTNLNKL